MAAKTKIVFISRENTEGAGGYYRSFLLAQSINSKDTHFQTFWLNYQDCNPYISEAGYTYWHHLKAQFKLLITLFRLKPDTVVCQRIHWHTLCVLGYTYLFKPKFILDLDDWEFKEKPSYFTEKFINHTVKKADHIIASTSFWPEYFVSNISLEIEIIPTHVPPPFFTSPKQFNTDKQSLTIGWLGSLDKKETLTDLISMLNMCFHAISGIKKKIQIYILIKGLYFPDFVCWIQHVLPRDLSEKIIVLNDLPRHLISSYLSQCDFGLLSLDTPSKFNASKCPVKLFHYLHHRMRPVIIGKMAQSLKISECAYASSIDDLTHLFSDDTAYLRKDTSKISLTCNREHDENTIIHKWVKKLSLVTQR